MKTAMRGDKLTEHILWTAKDVFLKMGFERASMDEIAARAQTSKRTLYAHFENKENLYLAVIDLVRRLLHSKMKTPADYPGTPAQALVMFCGRFLEFLLYAPTIRMCRLAVAAAERFPEGPAQYYDVIFLEAHARLSAYLTKTYGLSKKAGSDAAQKLIGCVIHPRFLRALFGLDELSSQLDPKTLNPNLDLKPIRKAIADLTNSLRSRRNVRHF